MGQSVLVNLPASSVTIADVGGYLSANTAEDAIQEISESMSTARGELDALLAPSLHQYAILPSFPNTSSSMYEGMAVYSLADNYYMFGRTNNTHDTYYFR